MKILVLNCGSSSIKYQLLDMTTEEVLAVGMVDRIGLPDGELKQTAGSKKFKKTITIPNHDIGANLILDLLLDPENGVLKDKNEITAVGHRIVHGAEDFSGSVKLTPDVLATIEKCAELAPLHNPANLAGINAISKIMPNVPQCGTFDTAFHQTLSPENYLYPIPYRYYKEMRIRKYGFHGTSHLFVSTRAAELAGLDYNKSKIITCHLGNGASVAAVKNGKSFDTSMGLTPLEGLMMGTRTGDIDPGAVFYMMRKENLTVDQIDAILNKKSGLLGISELSSDMRDIRDTASKGNQQSQLAIAMYTLRVKKYIAAMAASMGGVDCLAFTGGIGENSSLIREKIADNLSFMGLQLDFAANEAAAPGCGEAKISQSGSPAQIWVVPTNEELVIARDTLKLLKK